MNWWRKLFSIRRTAIETPENWSGSTTLPRSNIRITEQSALTYAAFFACVKILSETLAQLPWHLFKTRGDHCEIAKSHGLDRILHRQPNSEMTAFRYRELLMHQCLIWGNHYAEIERNRLGDVLGLWPLAPERVTVKRDEQGHVVYHVQSEDAVSVILPAARIFHVRGPSQDGLVGLSMVQLMKESLGLGLATEQFGAAFFGNGAHPGGIISNKSGIKLSEEGVRNLLSTFNRRHQGAQQASKVTYLDGGLEYQSVGMPPEDAQFLQTRQFQVTEIARWFRIPPHKLADLNRSTHNNIESQNIEFVTDAIAPWVARIEQEVDAQLLKPSEQNRYTNKLNLNALLRGDSSARGQFYQTLFNMGVLSINEIRDKEDLNPIAGGELRLVPLNMGQVEQPQVKES